MGKQFTKLLLVNIYFLILNFYFADKEIETYVQEPTVTALIYTEWRN